MKDVLKKFFFGPPKGGNEKGVQTTNSMAPLPQPGVAIPMAGGGLPASMQRIAPSPGIGQPNVRGAFEAGDRSARSSRVQAGQAGVPDLRNVERGRTLTQEDSDPSHENQYDREQESEGLYAWRREESAPDAPRRVTPALRPDTSSSVRSDGKPMSPMGTANGNASPAKAGNRNDAKR